MNLGGFFVKDIKLFDAELKFMNLIWELAPINSTELVKKATEELGWKKSTTYTVIRKLCKRGIIINENAVVNYIVDKKAVQRVESAEHIKKMFNGSIKSFLASFLDNDRLSEEEAKELKRIIDKNTKGGSKIE